MHVAYIHQHFSTRKGSGGTRSYEFGRFLVRAGHQVSLICGSHELSDINAEKGRRVSERQVDRIRVLSVAEPYSNKMGFARRLLSFGRFARTAARLVEDLRPDLVFATSTPLTVGIPGMKGAKKLNVPFVFEVRDLWPEGLIAVGAMKNKLLIWQAYRLEHKIYRAADHIIALSPGMKDGVCQTGYPPERVTVIPNGCDLDLFKPSDDGPIAEPRYGPPGAFKLVFPGAHGVVNGLDTVLDAAVELLRRGEEGVQFVFIGDGNRKEHLVQRSRREGTDRIISWLPACPREELSRVLPRMGAGMMILQNVPVLYYGTSPNKFFDYISSGLPVVNNYPGWLADMINEHRCGLAVPPNDPRAFADACVWLRDHRDEARQMGLRGRRLAEARFDRNVLSAQFLKVLEEAAARGPKPR